MATNVKGNYKGGKYLKTIPGEGPKTLIETTRGVKKGISFKSRAGAWGQKAKGAGLRASKHAAKTYGMYGKPTVSLARTIGKIAMKPVKWSLRAPGATLALTGAYYGAKKIINKGEKIASRPMSKQWKRKPFGKTGWTI